MRLAGVEKGGFYPTPPKTLDLLKALLARNAPHLRGRSALDPCAGEGEALKRVGEALGMKTYGIELEAERAKKARKVLDRVVQGDALQHKAKGFSLLWLNPPYDHGDGMRLEKAFLRRYLESVLPGGLLVLLVPERVLGDLWPTLTRAYEPRLAARLPRGEYETFHQAVVVAERVPPAFAQPRPYGGGELPHLEDLSPDLPLAFGEHLRKLKDAPRLEEERELSEEELLEKARTSPLWAVLERQSRPIPRPLLPLKQAHLALLVAGGALDLEHLEIGGEPYLLMGVLAKRTVSIEGEDEEKRIEQEVFVMKIRGLNLRTGEVLEVE